MSEFSILEQSVRNTCNTSKAITMSSWTSKKAFDRVWHAALWEAMRLHNINDNLIRTIECLNIKGTSAVYLDNNIGVCVCVCDCVCACVCVCVCV